ncbi:MAG: hypothetical protein ACRD00_00490, partial [Thermoanaerobaculia bacterium]
SLRVVFENGDNAPLLLDTAATVTAVARIDFVFQQGDRLTLLSGNPEASAARYDFTMIAPEILAAPAQPAALGSPVRAAAPAARTPEWLWAALAAAVVLVVLALARTLRASA